MQQFKTIAIVVIGLSLALQGLNIGAMAYGVRTFIQIDLLSTTTSTAGTYMQQNSGYYVYVLLASVISLLIYIFLLIVKILNKSYSFVQWILYLGVVIFQFGVAVLFSVLLKNNSVQFDNVESSLAIAASAGVTSTTLVVYADLIVFRKLSMAATILTFLICFIGSGFLFAKYTQDAKSANHEVGIEVKKQTSITELR